MVSKKGVEIVKWSFYLSVPIFFGYGLARSQTFIDILGTYFPSPAQDPQGDIGRQLPTLQDEYRRLMLEQAVDKVLADIKEEKANKKK